MGTRVEGWGRVTRVRSAAADGQDPAEGRMKTLGSGWATGGGEVSAAASGSALALSEGETAPALQFFACCFGFGFGFGFGFDFVLAAAVDLRGAIWAVVVCVSVQPDVCMFRARGFL